MAADTNHIPSYLHYYRVLGLRPGAGLSEIKRAYRTKAKKYHPDINKSETAADKFIEVNEAYEFLIRLEEQKTFTSSDHRASQSRSHSHAQRPGRAPTTEDLFREWMQRERQKARARAAREARKRYEDFKKSRVYRTSQVISAAYDYIFVGVGILIIISSVVGLFTQPRNNDLLQQHQREAWAGHIVATIALVVIGTVFIIFASLNIRERRGERKGKR